jgi:phosphoglycerate dehydrogenase-like enzyme
MEGQGDSPPRKQITIVDWFAMSEEDERRLRSLGRLAVYDSLPRDDAELLERIGASEIILTGGVTISGNVIRTAPRLEMITVWAAGYDHVDVAAAAEKGVVVCNVKDYAAVSVGEHALALVLALAKRLPESDQQVRQGGFDGMVLPGMELRGKAFGVIGTGSVGRYLCRLAVCLGCQVLAHDKYPSAHWAATLGVEYLSLDDLLRRSDVICLCVRLTPETRGLIGQRQFSLMERKPIFVNVARGALVDQPALLEALRSGQIRGAGLDVLGQEPPPASEPLLYEPGVIITPHKAWVTPEAISHSTRVCVDNIAAYLAGSPQNVVS